ncbi:MAG: hypothetical protein QM785_05575 [Pyrinomonadaceae bacterium]
MFVKLSFLAVLAFIFLAGSLAADAQTKPVPTKAGAVSVCKEIDDDWKCVGESTTWEANKKFNVLFINPVAMGVDFIGIIFHKQLPDGKDGDFLYEFQQQIGSDNRKYATTEAPFYLPAGKYTIYVTSWDKRDPLYHKGNFNDYFAKMTLTVK